MVFHRYLQQLNDEHRIEVTREPHPAEHCHCRPFRRAIEDTAELRSASPQSTEHPAGDPHAPKIGEVLPVEPEPQARAVTEVVFQQRTPITGRLVDILA